MYCYIKVPVLNMRERPEAFSKVVSQAVFSEHVQVQEDLGDWALIAASDSYPGWVRKEGLHVRKTPFLADLKTSRICCHLYALADTEYGPFATVPYASEVKLMEEVDARWLKVELPDEQTAFIQRGDVEENRQGLHLFSRQFLGLAYTWGGRSSFGFDCSGFIQTVYKHFGVLLPRDAKMQVLHPQAETVPLESLRLGDLIFWGKSDLEIQHVGIFLEGESFIHASAQENKPYLRISCLSDAAWKGEKDSVYPFRSAKRFAKLSCEDPKTECHDCDLGPYEEKQSVEVAVNKGFHFLSPKRHSCSDEPKANNSREGHVESKRSGPELENA